MILAPAFFVAVGYCSAALSLGQCDVEMLRWLPQDTPAGATPMSQSADRASLLFPFLVTASYKRDFLLAPQHYQIETGTRYYLVFFGKVMPIGVTNQTSEVSAD